MVAIQWVFKWNTDCTQKKSKYIFNIFSLPAFWISKQCLNEYGLQPPESVQLL